MRNEEYKRDIKEVYPSQMHVDLRYQRDIRNTHVKKIFGDFNINKVQMPRVSLRDDGNYYIMDGDHTVAVWKMKYGDKPIKCIVYYGLTWEEEAEIFLTQFGTTIAVTQKEKLNTRFNMGDPDVVDMKEAAAVSGFQVDLYRHVSATGKINATDALYYIYQRLGRVAFIDVLDTIMQCWDGEKESTTAGFLKGMCKFWETYHGQFRKNVLIARLKMYPTSWYVREAKSMTSGTSATKYCRAFLKVYNKGTSVHRLPDVL